MTSHEDPIDAAKARTAELAEVYGDALVSVTLYGSAARGEAAPALSDVNLLVLLRDLHSQQLLMGAAPARRWDEEGRAPPLLFTPAEWARAADVFAIEVADMLEAREVLHGPDPVEGMRVNPTELRLQAERELRGRVVQLRQGMLLCADRPPDLGRLLLQAAPSVATYLRAVARLDGGDGASGPTRRAAERVGERIGLDPAPFLRVWDAREAPQRFQPSIEDSRTEGFFDFVVAVADHVDRMDPRTR